MKILTEEGMKGIVELFLHMPDDIFEPIFLDETVIAKQKMDEESKQEYLKNLRTNIITVLLIGIQKLKDGVGPEFIARCDEIFNEIKSTEPGVNAQLMKILKNNNITIN